MKIPFKVRFSEGTKYTRGAILSAMAIQAYMPIQLSLVNPKETKVSDSTIAYGEEKDIEKYDYGVVFDDYKPDIVLSTRIPLGTERTMTNAVRGVSVIPHHAYMVSEVFGIIASTYSSGGEARERIRDFDDVMRITHDVFDPLFEEIKYS